MDYQFREEEMRMVSRFVITALLALVGTLTSTAATLTAADAKSHIGEQATVCGKVASERTATGSRGEPTFINLDAAYPNQVFTILIWGENRSSIGPLPSNGERVCATGRIKEYRGVPEVVVRSKAQLSR